MDSADINIVLPHFQKLVSEGGDAIALQCLNFSIERSLQIEIIFGQLFPARKLKSQIAIGNYSIDPDRELCFTQKIAEGLAEAPARAIATPSAHCHAWNIINDVNFDLTLLTSMKKLGAPVRAELAWSQSLKTPRYGFPLEWYPYGVYRADYLRELMDRHRPSARP